MPPHYRSPFPDPDHPARPTTTFRGRSRSHPTVHTRLLARGTRGRSNSDAPESHIVSKFSQMDRDETSRDRPRRDEERKLDDLLEESHRSYHIKTIARGAPSLAGKFKGWLAGVAKQPELREGELTEG
ncbi:hypothetical protein MTP99_019062 [Tenebrio molitor]|nr:hypothetical protein MTP99_019062 [Tenebrio molitor]